MSEYGIIKALVFILNIGRVFTDNESASQEARACENIVAIAAPDGPCFGIR